MGKANLVFRRVLSSGAGISEFDSLLSTFRACLADGASFTTLPDSRFQTFTRWLSNIESWCEASRATGQSESRTKPAQQQEFI